MAMLKNCVINKTQQAHTAHTSNPVPFIYVGKRAVKMREKGVLSDVAPTNVAPFRFRHPRCHDRATLSFFNWLKPLKQRRKNLRLTHFSRLLSVSSFRLCSLFFFQPHAHRSLSPNKISPIKQRFEILQSEIAQLQIHMQSNRTEYDRLQNDLQTAEKYISQLKQSLRNIHKKLPLQRDRLRSLQQRKNQYNQVLGTQQQQLSKQMHSAYIMGRQDYL